MVAVYAFFASAWIIITDLMVEANVSHNALDLLISMSKGLFFVFVTSLLLYFLVRRSQAHLRAREEHYRGLFNLAPVAYQSLDDLGRLVDVNQAWLAHMGYSSPDEVMQRLFESMVAPHDQERFRECLERVRAGEAIQRQEFDVMRQDGSSFLATFDARPVPRAESNGGAIHCIISDITEARRAEEALRRTEEQLRHSQKMEAIGKLAGGVAHDFNNLLLVIMGYTDLMAQGHQDPARMQRHLDMIRGAGERATSLTRQLLAFSRRQVLQPKRLDVNDIVRESARMLERMIREDISFTTHLAPHLPPVMADAGQLGQILMNLGGQRAGCHAHGGQPFH